MSGENFNQRNYEAVQGSRGYEPEHNPYDAYRMAPNLGYQRDLAPRTPAYQPPFDPRYPAESQIIQGPTNRPYRVEQPIYFAQSDNSSVYRPDQGQQLEFKNPYPIQGSRGTRFENAREYSIDQVAYSLTGGHLSSEFYTMIEKRFALGGVKPAEDYAIAVNSRLMNTPYYLETQEQYSPDGRDRLIVNLRDKRESGLHDMHGQPLTHGTVYLR